MQYRMTDQTLNRKQEVKSGTIVADVKGKPEGKFTFTSHDPGMFRFPVNVY
jgi:hypothetical protein